MIDGISIVIPAFNEVGAVGGVVRDLRTALDDTGLAYEILLVDDGSTDATAATAAEAGALTAGAGDDLCDAVRILGVNMGAAWQIARDTDDFWGQRGDAITASNIISKKKSLPIIHALEHGSVAAKREMGAIYMKRVLEQEDVARLVSILEETGARGAAEERARGLVEAGLAEASSAGVDESGMGRLRELGEWALSGGR